MIYLVQGYEHITDVPTCVISDFNEEMLLENETLTHKIFLVAEFTLHIKKQLETVVLCCTMYMPSISGVINIVTP